MKRPTPSAVLIAGLLAMMLLACNRSGAPSTTRTVFFRGEAVATVVEQTPGPRLITRVTRLNDNVITLTATLDADGFALAAVSDRPGRRHIELKAGSIFDDLGHRVAVPGRVLLLDLVHRVRATRKQTATLLDLASAESIPVTVERKGPQIVVVDVNGRVVVRADPEGLRLGPGAFAEGDAAPSLPLSLVEIEVPGLRSVAGKMLGGPALAVQLPTTTTTPAHLAAGIFFESDDPAVKALVACTGLPLPDAVAVAEKVHKLVDAAKVDEPPSARGMLAWGGDCDGAAALVTAALRSCGHPARAVVGFKLLAAGTAKARLVPHALAEVYSDGLWSKVDPTVPAIGPLNDTFLPIAEGLGGALTMGRVLGVLDAADLVSLPPAVSVAVPDGPR